MIISAVEDQRRGESALGDAVASCCSLPCFTCLVRCAYGGEGRKIKREERWNYSSYYVTDEERKEEVGCRRIPNLVQSSNF